MNTSRDLFLHCNNMTLNQYQLITLSRVLVGSVGCAASLVVLVVILLAARRRAWDTVPKRLYLITILYTAVFCAVSATGVHYSRPPAQESAWCEAMGFALHYSGSLLIASYMVLVTALSLQVVLPVFPALQTRLEATFSRRKLWEAILVLGCFFFPVLNTIEPFILPLDPYGNYGPLCWFRLVLDENCTYQHSGWMRKNILFLWSLPFGVTSFFLFVLILSITTVLCSMYCKFRKSKTGGRITKAIRQTVMLTIASFICVAWFIQFLINLKQSMTFSSWAENVTITPVAVTGIMFLVSIYIHFPLHLLYNCCRRRRPKHVHIQSQITEKATVPPSQWDHRNVPSVTMTHICHETVTTTSNSETSQLINNEQLNYKTFAVQST